MELISGKAEDKGTDVVDIIVVNYSTSRGSSAHYSFHPGAPSGPYHVRMNGTIFNGDTSLSRTISALSDTVTIYDSDLPCVAGTWTPVSGLTDPAYSPLRLTIADFDSIKTIFPQSAVSGPYGGIPVVMDLVDVLFDDTLDYNATAEVLNTVTGFNAGAQAAILGEFTYETSNFTLDPGSWKASLEAVVRCLEII
ncbi:BTB domain-containing protein [Mycena sanguinolenta]|uniref:BTB domain-containing protein n=1 Tax=Mycena sanguinolenta TaxID=230812 RepID=A0A8H6YHK2_9AGAR|nr:BTB domain-containing protein [Mycena sanguinolenta]